MSSEPVPPIGMYALVLPPGELTLKQSRIHGLIICDLPRIVSTYQICNVHKPAPP